MEDLGDILFYIIAAVIGLVTALGKKKKKPAAPLPSKAEPVEEQDEGPVFEEIDELDYQVDDKDFVIEGPLAFDPAMEGKYTEAMAGQFSDEGKAQLFQDKVKASASTPEEKQGSGEEESTRVSEDASEGLEDILSDFDLRKAVIYSEILDRKDY